MASCGLQDILIFHGMDEKLSINPTVRMTWPVSTMTMFLGFARHKITPSVATIMPPKRALRLPNFLQMGEHSRMPMPSGACPNA